MAIRGPGCGFLTGWLGFADPASRTRNDDGSSTAGYPHAVNEIANRPVSLPLRQEHGIGNIELSGAASR